MAVGATAIATSADDRGPEPERQAAGGDSSLEIAGPQGLIEGTSVPSYRK